MVKVMIVDDEVLERQALRLIITNEIKEAEIVCEAENGRKAIELAKRLRPDLILMDIKMPGVDGCEAVNQIISEAPKTKFIMVTAFDEFEYARKVMKYGVKEYLLKPSRNYEIVQAIERVIAEIKAERMEREEYERLQVKFKQALAFAPSNVIASVLDGQNETDDLQLTTNALNKAKDYINSHYTKAISLEEVAEHVQLSTFYFSKLFKERFSITFIDYVTILRIEKAKELIKKEEQSLKEICFNVGYKDPNYFSRVFKKITGMSPREFRQRQLNIS